MNQICVQITKILHETCNLFVSIFTVRRLSKLGIVLASSARNVWSNKLSPFFMSCRSGDKVHHTFVQVWNRHARDASWFAIYLVINFLIVVLLDILAICKFVNVGIDFSDKSKLYIFPSIQSVEANYIRESLLKWIQEIYYWCTQK